MQSKQFAVDEPYIVEYGIHAARQAEIAVFKPASVKSDI
jgi:hypothetical protein